MKYTTNHRADRKKLKKLELKSNILLYKKLADESSDGIVCFNESGNYIYANYVYAKLLNVKRKQLIGRNLLDFYKRNDAEKFLRLLAEVCRSKECVNAEFEYNVKGTSHFISECLKPIIDVSGKVEMVLCTLKDVTELKNMETESKEREYLFHKAQLVASLGSYVLDLQKNIYKCTEELDAILGIDKSYPHNMEGWLNLVCAEWREPLLKNMSEAEYTHSKFDFQYKIIRQNDEEERWVHVLGEFKYDKSGNAVQLIGTLQDITGRKKTEEEIIYLSYHDKLTGLYNRRFYEEIVEKLDVENNFPLTVIMGDVNGLKLINDAFGHLKGDELLEKSASVMKQACREGDIIIRWGGDEFIILLQKADEEAASEIVERIKQLCEKELINDITLSISFGYATKTNSEEDMLKILKSAEDNMYNHKIIEKQLLRGKVIYKIINTFHKKNQREQKHSERVCEVSRKLGMQMGLSASELNELQIAAYLHDIGKIAIQDNLINKKSKLSLQEEMEIKRHSDIGYRILSSSYNMLELADYIYTHHERWDGKGYPNGLEGKNIPIISRIIAIAEAYDTLVSEQPYRTACSKEEALLELKKNAGTQFDPDMIGTFEQIIK
ncbi:HD domain-containing phosphohydrolase [Sinanaerobacter sp. ZZT-01]|uniref:HD domain-containing phosphohydrolase n=1 Tax=Sinanaerobacter sp. ZZT-01 TaxID=3111540 RepID=UPI002D778F27|nr:HD domain-containing phosphohydrolase [Sinanaerobacter sp. ZZT-01]WRR92376.1 HD domain-containing phosphohydrolase [Sinanaerobacter sp. ZZT-01]